AAQRSFQTRNVEFQNEGSVQRQPQLLPEIEKTKKPVFGGVQNNWIDLETRNLVSQLPSSLRNKRIQNGRKPLNRSGWSRLLVDRSGNRCLVSVVNLFYFI